jgi:MFS family permease
LRGSAPNYGLGGLAASAGFLVVLRFLQGAGAAIMIPQVLSLIQRTHAGPARARAMSSYSAVLAGGAVVGQLVGGLLISANLFGSGWRPVFLVNVPIGAVLLVAGARALPHGRGEPGRTVDLPGLACRPGRARVRPAARARPAGALAGLGLDRDGGQRAAGLYLRPG